MKTTAASKATGCVVTVAKDASKDELLPFAQHVAVDGKSIAGPFWSYSSAELACRVARYTNPNAVIVRADEME